MPDIGVLASFDFTGDDEVSRWVPSDIGIVTTRTRPVPMKDNLRFVSDLGTPSIVTRPARQLAVHGVAAALYACTACSFAHGHDGERRLRERMQASGIRRPWTTSGAVVKALTALHARTVVIIHPYAADVADRLAVFLAEAGIDVVAGAQIDVPMTEVDSIDATSLTDLVLGTDLTHADAVFISCTNVPTYDVIAPLELQLGIPVVTANQAGMWAALRSAGVCACGPGQALIATSQPRVGESDRTAFGRRRTPRHTATTVEEMFL